MIRVCLAEDQVIVRQGLHALLDLADDIEVVAEASDGVEAVTCVERHTPDVLLLDMRLPRLDGVGVLKELAARSRLPPTIILTTFDDDVAAVEAVRAGARGYLLKDVSLDQLTLAVQVVAAGGTMILPASTERHARGVHDGEQHDALQPPPEVLTPREIEVLRVMAAGYSNREIAHALRLAEGTVKNHVSMILAKLGVRDRTRAVLRAINLGLGLVRR